MAFVVACMVLHVWYGMYHRFKDKKNHPVSPDGIQTQELMINFFTHVRFATILNNVFSANCLTIYSKERI